MAIPITMPSDRIIVTDGKFMVWKDDQLHIFKTMEQAEAFMILFDDDREETYETGDQLRLF